VDTVVALVALGSFHGFNPAMGWLFAVAVGLQRQSRLAVLAPLIPIALGHEASVTAVAMAFEVTASAVAQRVLTVVSAAAVVAFGCYLLLRRRHFTWVGMRLRWWQFALWSFLMSSAHGAGLMLFPLLAHDHAARSDLLITTGVFGTLTFAATAAAIHTAAMLVVMGGVALFVYEVAGLAVLRRAWINLDRVWALAMIGAGCATILA
jgi:hypothetical protein